MPIMGRSATGSMLFWLLWTCLFTSTVLAQNRTLFTRGQKFQIILLGVPDTSKPPTQPTDAPVWDIDLFDTDASTISALKAQGYIVICYFSGGTWEDWRTDAKDFPAGDVGKVLPEWPNEKWIRTGSAKVRDIMAKRIRTAAEKGCDAIDPDNMDGYQNDNGLSLTPQDATAYLTWMARNASALNLQIGLKNSIDILPSVAPLISFAVNEQCAALGECIAYNDFLASGKPVFHIEYPANMGNPQQVVGTEVCRGPGVAGMSTVLKAMQLDGKTVYCDGSVVDTPVKGGGSPPRPSVTVRPPRPSTSSRVVSSKTSVVRSSTTTVLRSSTTTTISRTTTPRSSSRTSSRVLTTIPRPSSTSRTSTQRPTSTAVGGGNGGCKSKHWDQCGGNDWKGCTQCESPYTCKGVSPPYYYQCL